MKMTINVDGSTQRRKNLGIAKGLKLSENRLSLVMTLVLNRCFKYCLLPKVLRLSVPCLRGTGPSIPLSELVMYERWRPLSKRIQAFSALAPSGDRT